MSRRVACVLWWLASSLASMQVAVAEPAPRRVVSVGGAVTEIVYALGADDRLVAVDTTSVYPREVQALPQVGYQRQLSAEGVLAMKPDLVIATADAGPPAVMRQLREAGLRVESIPVGYTPQALQDKVRRIAGALGLRDVRYQRVAEILAAARNAGLTKLSFVTDPSAPPAWTLHSGAGPN